MTHRLATLAKTVDESVARQMSQSYSCEMPTTPTCLLDIHQPCHDKLVSWVDCLVSVLVQALKYQHSSHLSLATAAPHPGSWLVWRTDISCQLCYVASWCWILVWENTFLNFRTLSYGWSTSIWIAPGTCSHTCNKRDNRLLPPLPMFIPSLPGRYPSPK